MSRLHLRYGLYGLIFGFVLSRMGFGDFQEVHNMFLLEDLRLHFSFGGGMALSMIGFKAFIRDAKPPPRPIHPGSIIGGLIFGAGWAITGACPSIVLVQIGAGIAPAFGTLMGAVIGVVLYGHVHRRFFSWDMGSCAV